MSSLHTWSSEASRQGGIFLALNMVQDGEVTDEAIQKLINDNLNVPPSFDRLRHSLEDWLYPTTRNDGIPLTETWSDYDPHRESHRNYIHAGYPKKFEDLEDEISSNRDYQIMIELGQAVRDPMAREYAQDDLEALEFTNWLDRARIWARHADEYEEYEAECIWELANAHAQAAKQARHRRRPEKSSFRTLKALKKTKKEVKFAVSDDGEEVRTPRSPGGGVIKGTEEPHPWTEEMRMEIRERERWLREARARRLREETGMLYHWEKKDVEMGEAGDEDDEEESEGSSWDEHDIEVPEGQQQGRVRPNLPKRLSQFQPTVASPTSVDESDSASDVRRLPQRFQAIVTSSTTEEDSDY